MADRSLAQYVRTGDSVPSTTAAAVTAGNVAWAKFAKTKIMSSGSWDRRAYIYALSVLAKDERDKFLGPLSKNSGLTLLDKWVIAWVSKGCPAAPRPSGNPFLE